MKLALPDPPARLSGPTQIARFSTETWVRRNLYCPSCLACSLNQFEANAPVADFFCSVCDAEFELKAKKTPFGTKLVNGAYASKVARIQENATPNFLLLQYSASTFQVQNLTLIPGHFFHLGMVERRPPLAPTARRAGWIGSNIRLDLIPSLGRISIIRDGHIMNRKRVSAELEKTAFLAEQPSTGRGWFADVVRCVEQIADDEFTLKDMYLFEEELSALYPGNNNVRAKVRQQLQLMRDKGFLNFIGQGKYQKIKN